jgi:hypothetical protein
MCEDAAGDALPISAARDVEIGDDYWVPRRRAQDAIGTCHLCLKLEPLSFEHVPPRAAFNSSRVDVQGLEHWLSRGTDGPGLRKTIQQGGQGLEVFCAHCNNETGSWYASELTGWVHGAVAAMRALPPIGEMDQELEPHVARLRINQVRPLAFVKQIITMVLAVNDIGFAERHAALRRFVRERDQRGLPDDVQLYLALFCGPIIRRSGVQGKLVVETAEQFVLSEIAHPPFAYMASFDEPSPTLPVGNISGFADVSYTARADVEIDLLVGFGHTVYPSDYRTKAQMERDRGGAETV